MNNNNGMEHMKMEPYGKASIMTRMFRTLKQKSDEYPTLPTVSNLNKYDTHDEEY